MKMRRETSVTVVFFLLTSYFFELISPVTIVLSFFPYEMFFLN